MTLAATGSSKSPRRIAAPARRDSRAAEVGRICGEAGSGLREALPAPMHRTGKVPG